MADGLLMWAIGFVICILSILSGMWISRAGQNEQVAAKVRFGRLQAGGAIVFFLFWTALLSGVFGPVDGIETIKWD